jgi:hypothetical protein
MTNIRAMLSTILSPAFPRGRTPSTPPEGQFDRIYHDLIGLSDTDAMWYYELRKWRGMD